MQALYLANNQLEKLSLAAGVEVGEVDISGNSITCSEYAFDAQFGLCVDGPGNTVFDQVVKHLNLVGCFSADAFYKSVHFVRCSGQVKPDTKFLQIPCYRASLGGH